MTARKSFSNEFRAALLDAHHNKCAYCHSPIYSLTDFHIEHIIELETPAQQLESVLAKLGLPADFDLNDPLNLLPSCPTCNLRKKSNPYGINSIVHFHEVARNVLAKVKDAEARLKKQKWNYRLQCATFLAVERGNLTVRQLNELFQEKSIELKHHKLLNELVFSDEIISGLLAKGDAWELMNKPIFPKNDGIASFEMAHDTYPSVEVRTCAEWVKAIENDYYALTTIAIKMETYFKHTFAILKALQIARPAIPNAHLSITNISALPLEILPWLGDEDIFEARLVAYKQQHFTLADLQERGELVVEKQADTCLRLEYDGMILHLSELLAADLNEDGIAELLVGSYMRVVDGTFGAGDILILGQTDCGGMTVVPGPLLRPQKGPLRT